MKIKQFKEKTTRYLLYGSLSLSLFFIQCSSAKVNGQGGKYKYDRFHSSDFPAYLEAVIFSGYTLSSSSTLKWGNWTISFSKTESATVQSGGSGEMHITGLTASNPVQGEYICAMQFCKACAYTGEQADKKLFIRRCRILIGSDAKADADITRRSFGTIIVIDCPADVLLK